MVSSGSRNSESRSTSTRRYWRKTDIPRPWWPWGLLPFLGLVVTFLIGAIVTAPRLEANVLEQVQERLDGQQFESTVSTDGQGVLVRATADEQNRSYVDALARSTQCDTWVGKLTCPTTVRLEFDEARIDAAPADVVQTTSPAEPTQPDNKAGEIGIVDEPVAPMSGTMVADMCNDEFASIFQTSTITFRTSSAKIDAGNDELLSRVADVAMQCSGTLQIEGHTDSQGDAGMNLALSNARAESVRAALIDRGIEADRLRAQGFGEVRPIADNDTPIGRAENRRIVISVQE